MWKRRLVAQDTQEVQEYVKGQMLSLQIFLSIYKYAEK